MTTPTVITGLANPRSDSLNDILIDRFHYAEETYIAGNFLVNQYVAKYGNGWRHPDTAKGEKGLCSSFSFKTLENHDPELNYLFRSFVFTSKASTDQGFLLLEKFRDKIETKSPKHRYPKPIGGGNITRFLEGCAADKYDGLDPRVSLYYNKYKDIIIFSRIIRNNVKEIGKPNFEQTMNRPYWKIQLTRRDLADKGLEITDLKLPSKSENVLTISMGHILHQIYSNVEQLHLLNQISKLEEHSRNFVTEKKLATYSSKHTPLKIKLATML